MAPITVNPRAEEIIKSRKTKVQSWYFDLNHIMDMWGSERAYHHTPPISLIYALREAMRIVVEEGLERAGNVIAQIKKRFIAGIEAMGLLRSCPIIRPTGCPPSPPSKFLGS